MAPESYTRAALVARLRTTPPLETLFTADDLERQKANAARPLRPAAVLVLVVAHREEPAIVFTQRTRHLADHAGQISFPGGRCTDEDCTPERTALREAEEEIGIDPARVEILGRLPDYLTSTGFDVTPVVGWIEPPVDYRAPPCTKCLPPIDCSSFKRIPGCRPFGVGGDRCGRRYRSNGRAATGIGTYDRAGR